MTIFIEHLVAKGYCHWANGKVIVSSSCPSEALQELKSLDKAWRERHPDSGSIVIFTQPMP